MGEGKGANSAPEKPPPPTRQTGPWFLSKEFLRFWMVDIRCGRVAARGQVLTNSEQTQASSGARWDHGGKRRAASGESVPKPLAA